MPRLRAECGLPAISPGDPQPRRGCFYSLLALYMFHRVWLARYPWSLATQSAPQEGPGSWKLRVQYGGQDYAYGSEEEMIALHNTVDALIGRLDITTLKNSATVLQSKLEVLQQTIATIHANGILQGDCDATKGSARIFSLKV